MIRIYGGLLNGEIPSSAYGLFSAPGVPSSGYSKSFNDRVSAKASFSFDIGNHSIKFGFDFDQSITRSHSVSPVGLWQLMRDIANKHIQDLDTIGIPRTDKDDGRFVDTIDYNRLVNRTAESTFSKNFREYLVKKGEISALDSTHWVDIDSYDPSEYSLEMFSATDLFNSGGSLIGFSGYDYTGKKRLNTPVTMSDMKNWFNGGSQYPDFSEIGANKPIRISAYLQDKFAIKSLYFDLGLRLDVFDRNQPYVKDMYLYRDAYTVKEALDNHMLSSAAIPDFIEKDGANYYVYVTDISDNISQENITAFRSGKVWYNPSGQEVTDPNTLAKEGKPELLPLLKNYDKASEASDITKVRYDAFDDYTPTFDNGGIALSPRLAFAFVVGENSKFTASYNVITKPLIHPLEPVKYLYFSTIAASGSTFNNTGLRPEKNINYDIGFEQAINKKLKVSFSAYYSEKRDQLQVYHFSQAYPASYYSYTNMDFGTTQGFILGMEMRRTTNLSFTASYTLQFAKGTGSSAESSLALIRLGQPNLRTLTVLSFDQRHKLNFNLIYQFDMGPAYNGPITKKEIKNTGRIREIKWLEMSGVSLTFSAASGLPYTASSEPYSTIVGQGTRVVKGSINGSRMPWMFTCDLNIWKGFPIVLKKSDDPRARKMGAIVVSLAIRDLLELDEIMSVYSYTGSAVDDGFLTASKFQNYIAAQENVTSFTDYYTIGMEGNNRLGQPRRFNLSVRIEF
jgi:outer membrane receptor protein involved in Fe transport